MVIRWVDSKINGPPQNIIMDVIMLNKNETETSGNESNISCKIIPVNFLPNLFSRFNSYVTAIS